MIISCASTWNGDNKCHARCLRSHLNVNKYIGMAILEPSDTFPSLPNSALIGKSKAARSLPWSS